MAPKLFAEKIDNNNKCMVGVILTLYHENNTIYDSLVKKKKWCVIVMWHFNQCYGILINIILT
jgi:hypothetical protein